jgi:thioredoxin reductase (NADPH)
MKHEPVIVYSSTGCSYCAKIKSDLEQWNIPFEERNVTDNEDYFKELESRGIYSVPTTLIGEEAVVGYRPNKMKALLGISL